MNNIVHNVTTEATIYFANGTSFSVPMSDPLQQGLSNYCTSISIKEQLYSQNNNNVVGNVCANTLSMKLISKDGLLISSNDQSTYYGYMNNTAYIDVAVTGDDNVRTVLGRYFVEAWENGVTASTANEVNISAVDLLGKIKNISLRKIRLQRNLSIQTYLKSILDKLNSELPSTMQIQYNLSDLNIFHNSGYNWQLLYNNIDRDTFENVLNNIAQNTLSHLWIDRNRYFKTDWLLDDSQEQHVCDVSGSTNVLDYGTNIADTSKASGIEVTYIDNVSYNDKELASIKDYSLNSGVNQINNANLNSDKILSVNTIETINQTGTSKCVSFFNYKNSIDLKILSTASSVADIKIWGTVINEITNIVTMYKSNSDKNNIIQIDNRILRKELIQTYATGLLNLISLDNANIYVEGFINPQVKIGDMVSVVGSKLGIDADYKVIGVELTLGTSYRCRLQLLRTFEVE